MNIRPIFLFCHGETDSSSAGRIQGSGRQQARGMVLPSEKIVDPDEPQDAFYRLQAGAVARIAVGG